MPDTVNENPACSAIPFRFNFTRSVFSVLKRRGADDHQPRESKQMFATMKAAVERQGKVLARLVDDENGAAMVEYALLVALVSVVAIIALQTVGSNLSSVFNRVATDL